jgi:hypothetical protein
MVVTDTGRKFLSVHNIMKDKQLTKTSIIKTTFSSVPFCLACSWVDKSTLKEI